MSDFLPPSLAISWVIAATLLVRAIGWWGLPAAALYLIVGTHVGVVLSRKRGVPEPDIRALVVFLWPLVVAWCAIEKIRGIE